ncbi:MAG TPA: phospholipid carrier-dependent glycosyltransferase [Spirochaetia bacterium]|nr:phospholipid carrier-dependent glycosyltransferase [Spirochaetia bacterium]
MKFLRYFLLVSVLVIALVARLYKIDNPIADWHSFRQADTASVTRNFVDKGVNLLVPTYHDVSNIQSGFDNPEGFRMVEFPLYNLLHLEVYKLVPNIGLDMAGRLTSVILSLVSIVFMYLIVNKLSGLFMAFLTSLFMAILPFNIFYSRVILPEPLMIMTLLASYWFLLQVSETVGFKKRLFLLLSSVFLSLAVLVKPFALFFALPHLAILFRSLAKKELNFLDILSYAAVSLAPFGLWRKHIASFPTGVPASDWLLNQNGIRFRPAWFRWLFGERLGKLILGSWGTSLLILGIIAKPAKEGIAYWLWFIGILLYFTVVAGGNIQHDYYQAIITPFLCIFLAKGTILLMSLSRTTYSRLLTLIMTIVVVGFMIALSWYDIKGYYQINNPVIIEAGQRVDQLTPKDAKVIAPYNGDTAFLYQTHRSGWPLGYDIEKHIDQGATYYVSVNFDDEMRQLEKKYQVVEKTEKYIIIKLTPKSIK